MFSKKRPSKKGCFIFEKHLKAMIKQSVKTATPAGREICGVVVSDGCRLQLVRLENETKQPGSFSMDYRQIRKVKRAARKVDQCLVGTFHSHPFSPAEPGETDILGTASGTLMLVIGCQEQEAKLWWIKKRRVYSVPLQVIKAAND